MVHVLRMLKCKEGHILPICFDSNECGCHHDGKPCLMINCHECIKEDKVSEIVIPLDEDGVKAIKELMEETK